MLHPYVLPTPRPTAPQGGPRRTRGTTFSASHLPHQPQQLGGRPSLSPASPQAGLAPSAGCLASITTCIVLSSLSEPGHVHLGLSRSGPGYPNPRVAEEAGPRAQGCPTSAQSGGCTELTPQSHSFPPN